MVSSARQALCIFLFLSTVVCVQAQTTTQRAATGSISGKVTIKGKPAVGVMVLAKDSNDHQTPPATRYSARTDQTGSFRITKLPAGTYEISPITLAFALTNQSSSVVVSEGEELKDVDLSLVPGAVITGKITDSEGEPLIGQYVRITPVSELLLRGLSRFHSADRSTDDRGIYRAFGLPPGKYKVSVGESAFGMRSSPEPYKETFYHSVTVAAKATIIEVTEGSETNNIDIAVGRPVETFSAAGRVVDGETGRPIPNVNYGVGQRIVHDQHSSSSSSVGNDVTNANGEFRLENLTAGTYTIFTVARDGSDVASTSATFDVVDRDVTDLLIKTTKGSSLSGVVVLDANQRMPTTPGDLRICASVESRDSDFINPSSSTLGQDGTFRISGLRNGPVRLQLCYSGDKSKQFEIIRVERNGILLAEPFNVKEHEHVAGLRVLVKYLKLTGSIRGQVKVENGEPPPAWQLRLSLWPLDENLQPKRMSSIPSPQVDARGRFFAEGLPAGTYQLTIYHYQPGRTRRSDMTTQQVTVTDDTVTEVTLIIKPQADPKLN